MIKIGRYEFDGPWPLAEIELLDRACVYVILCQGLDGRYKVIYIGEMGQAGSRLSNHEKYYCWKRNCYSVLSLAVFSTPSYAYTQQDRGDIEKK